MATVKAPLTDNTKYYVMAWDVKVGLIAVYDDLKSAKTAAKAQGSVTNWLGQQISVAFVAADTKDWDYARNQWSETETIRCVVYNPRFK